MKGTQGKHTTILRHVLRRILPIVLPVLLVAFILTYEFTRYTIERQQYENIENELSFANQTLGHRFAATKDWLGNLSANGMIVNSLVDPKGAGEYIPQLFKTLRVPGPQTGGSIELLNFQGKILATNNIKTVYKANDSWLRRVLSGESYTAIDRHGMIMAEPIVINGLPEGMLLLFFDLPTLSQFLKVSSANNYISVIDTRYNHFLFTPAEQNYFQIGQAYDEENFSDWTILKKPIDEHPELALVSAQRNGIAFQAVVDVQYALIGFIIISLGGILLSLSMAGRNMKAVLTNVARQLQVLRTEKDLSKRIQVSAIVELAELENSYNEMAEELQDTTVSKDDIDRIFEGMPLPVFVVDVNGYITKRNEPVLSMFKQENNAPDRFQDLIVREDLQKHQDELVQHFAYTPENAGDAFFYLAQKHGTHEMEMRLRIGDAENRPYILSITSLKNYQNKITGYIITATDIQDQKNKEKEILELAEQNTLMARAIEEIDLGVTISDGRQRHQPLIFCNQAFMEISGRTMEEIIGFSCDFMQGPETDPATMEKISTAIQEQQPITVEILNYKKDGTSFWNELSLNPIFAHDGGLKYYVGIQNDISDRKRIDAMKKEFISTVSHELRTPLTSIHGSLGLINDLYEGDFESEEKELLSLAYRNSERLKFLVDDILDTEKLDAGEMRFYPKYYALPDIIQQGIDLNAAYGEKYGVIFEVSGQLPDSYVHVDKDRMLQVFSNLLSNAAKFSKDSKQVHIKAEKLEWASGFVRISIMDHGEGISKEFQRRIFTKFAQHDSSDARKLPGTGLGLYITKKIIEAHSGEIDFKTKAGEGTTFFMDLPCYDTPEEEGEQDEQYASENTDH